MPGGRGGGGPEKGLAGYAVKQNQTKNKIILPYTTDGQRREL